MNLKFKNYFLNYVKNKNSDYPFVKGGKYGDTKLKDIYNFLLSGKDSPNNKKWPDYIEKTIEHNSNLKKKLPKNNTNKDTKPYIIKNMKKI